MNTPDDGLCGRSRWISDATLLRWAPKAYLAVAVGLVPWVVYLAVALPRRSTAAHYRLAWVGFDCFLALALARTAYLGYRRRQQAELTAVVTATPRRRGRGDPQGAGRGPTRAGRRGSSGRSGGVA